MFWNFGDGKAPLSPWRYASHIYDLQGNPSKDVNVSLAMIDMYGNLVTVNQPMTIRQGGQFPMGNVTIPFTGNQGASLGFDATGVTDPLALPLNFQWDFADASPLGAGVSTGHSYSGVGVYQPSVLVYNSDRRGARYSGLLTVNAAEGTNPISPNIHATPESGVAPLTVQFDASGTTLAGSGTVAEYFWGFGDGSAWPQVFATGPQTSFTFKNAGTYYVNLFVKDSNGNVNMINKMIAVSGTKKDALATPVLPPTGFNGREGCYEVNGHTECYSRDGEN